MRKIITSVRGDGLGAQLIAMINSAAYAFKYPKDYEYVHTPISSAWFATKNEIRDFEKLIGFKHSFRTIGTIEPRRFRTSGAPYLSIHKKPYDTNRDFILPNQKEQNKFYSKRFCKLIKKNYAKYLKPKNLLASNSKNIAIHYRSWINEGEYAGIHGITPCDGDCNENCSNKRYISDPEFCKLVKKIKDKYPNHGINVFGAGVKDFNPLRAMLPSVKFFINTPTVESFYSMSKADILFVGRSTFSYCAGLFSDGVVHKDFINDSFLAVPPVRWKLLEMTW